MNRRRAATIGFAVAATAGVALAIATRWSVVQEALALAHPAWLGAAGIVAPLGMLALALPWRGVLGAYDTTASNGTVVRWYFAGEIGKYVPGGIWSVIGRAELATRGGVARARAYTSVAASLVLAYAAAACVAGVGLLVAPPRGGTGYLWALLVPLLAIVSLHPACAGRLVAGVERTLARDLAVTVPPWRTSLVLALAYVPAWILISTATACVTVALSSDVRFTEAMTAAVISWIVGFVVVIAPGGAGVREATFAALLPLPFAAGLAIAVTARVMFVAVDAIGALVATRSLR